MGFSDSFFKKVEKKTNVDEFKEELKIDIEETEEYKKAVDVKKTSTKKK